ncbi:MAG: hypothetical protein O3B15_08400 [Actinomycetota bacterium]|nr:hypothetical protein [Actinomycetota bacterium]
MAKDDDNLDPKPEEEFLEDEAVVDVADPDELLEVDLEDEEDLEVEDLDTVLAEEDPEAEIVPLVAKKKAKKSKKVVAEDEEEDDEDEIIGEDDIEEDLGVILAARVKGRSEDDEEEPEEEEDIQLSNDPESGIQPKRADERMCTQCFLLVRKGAPLCPIGDDTCPLFL